MNLIIPVTTLVIFVVGCKPISEEKLSEIEEKCQNESVETIQAKNDISDECREAIQSILPSPEDSLSQRLFSLGKKIQSDSQVLYLAGTDSSGQPISRTGFDDIKVNVTLDGKETLLEKSQYTISSVFDAANEVMSISFVTDYSASMRDEDIQATADIYTDLVTNLNPVMEGESLIFSDNVERKAAFTNQLETLESGVKIDNSYVRSGTALYDGMGTGLDTLKSRSYPVKVMLVSTDGMENSSTTFTEEGVISTINDHKVFVLMMGALWSDKAKMKSLAGARGAFIYVKSLTDIRDKANAFTASLKEAVSITLTGDYKDASLVKISQGDKTAEF